MKIQTTFLLATSIIAMTACSGGSGGSADSSSSVGESSSSLASSSSTSASISSSSDEASSSLASSSSSSSPELSLEDKLAIPPSDQSVEELRENYSAYAWSRYQGQTDHAEVTSTSAQAVAATHMGEQRLLLPNFPLTPKQISEQISLNASSAGAGVDGDTVPLEFSLPCSYGGSIWVVGDANAEGLGNFSVDFRHCMGHASLVHGSAGVSYLAATEGVATHRVHYYKNLRVERDSHTAHYTGYYSRRTEPDTNNTYTDLYVLGENLVGHQFLHDIEAAQSWNDSYQRDGDGRVYVSDVGYVNVEIHNTAATHLLKLHGSTDHVADVERHASNDATQLRLDENGDGVDDIGAMFPTLQEFLDADIASIELVDVDLLGLPPHVSVWFDNWAPLTTETIIATANVYDSDTPLDEIIISFAWYLNDQVVEGVTGDTLPAGVAVYGDTVSVEAVVNDGYFTVKSNVESVVIADSPATVDVSDVPATASVGDTVQFQVVVNDPDSRGAEAANIAYAPAGTAIDAEGTVTWQVDQPLFNSTNISFGFKTSPDSEELEKVEVLILDDSVRQPIARAGIEVPYRNDAMHIGNFAGDASNEILAMDRRHRFFLLSETDGSYAQTWMYPYQLPNDEALVQVITAELDDDVQQEIVVAGTNNVYTLSDTNAELKQLWTVDQEIVSISVRSAADQMLLAVYSKPAYGAGARLDVLQLDEQVTLLFSTAIPDSQGKEVAFANVDEDDAIELVLDAGLVYETATWVNEWYSSDGFSGAMRQDMEILDIDGDGFNEITTVSNSDGLKVFSASSKQMMAHFPDISGCALGSAVTGEQQILIVGSCQWGNTRGYSWNAGVMVEQWSLAASYDSKSITTGDVDGDGSTEVIFGTGQGHSGQDSLVVVEFTEGGVASVAWDSGSAPQLNRFAAAGWGEVTPGEERAVYIVPSTTGETHGQRLVMMDSTGVFSLSEQTSDNWEGGDYGKVTDFNLDGYADIFLATATRYDGSFAALQLSDMTSFWATTGAYENNIGAVESFDLNGDGLLDAIYANSSVVSVVDISNKVLLGGVAADQAVRDLAIAEIEGLGRTLVIATYESLQLHTYSGSMFTLGGTAAQPCTRIAFGNFDSDAQRELVCSGSNWGSSTTFVVYELGTGLLTEKHRFVIEGEVTDFVVDTRTSSNQNLLAGIYKDEYLCSEGKCSWRDVNTISGIAPTGGTVWNSPMIIGKVAHRSMHFRNLSAENEKHRLMFATQYGMYQIH